MLRFCNQYPREVWVSIMWYHPNCSDGGNWEKKGWWHLFPGECKVVFGEDLDEINRYYTFFAHASDGAVWAGPYVRAVPHTAYDWCEWTANTDSRDVGFRLLDIGDNDDYTVNLVP